MPQTTAWKIQEAIRWPAILGVGFGVPALMTFVVSTSQRVPSGYGFTIVLSVLSFLFFLWDWRRHRIPPNFLSETEVVIRPKELQVGAVASCEVRLPFSSSIKVRTWSFSIGIAEIDDPTEDEEIGDFGRSVFSEASFVSKVDRGTQLDDTLIFRGEIFVPKRSDADVKDEKLGADVNIRLRLRGLGTWRYYVRMPVEVLQP